MKKLLSILSIMLIMTLSFAALCGCEESFSAGSSDLYEETASDDGEIVPPGGTETPPSEDENEDETEVHNEDETPYVYLGPTSEDENENETEVHNEDEAPYVYRGPTSDRETYVAACAAANVNVRRGASTDYDVLYTLGIGDSLPYLWREGEWLAVWTGERVGYLSAGYAYLSETNEGIERTIRAGLKKLGTPYEWGATRRISGSGIPNPFFTGNSFDCSSFVQYCYYEGMGIKLGSYTGSQADYTVGEIITDYDLLKRGDFYFTGTDGTISHVVIYLGGGLLLQTYSANGGPVSVTEEARWKRNFLSGRRPDPTVVVQFR